MSKRSKDHSPNNLPNSSSEDGEDEKSEKGRKSRNKNRETRKTKTRSSPRKSSSTSSSADRSPDDSDTRKGSTSGKIRRRKDDRWRLRNSYSGRESSWMNGKEDRTSSSTAAAVAAAERRMTLFRWQRLEPKYEPRRTLFKSNDFQNGLKSDTTNYFQHRRKIALARPVVDNKPPQFFAHIYCNMKKLKIQQDRQHTIDKDNKLLLGKLVTAMTTTRVDNWNSNVNSRNSSHADRIRKQNNSQIDEENRKMEKRINSRKSTFISKSSSCRGRDKDHQHPHHELRQQDRSEERSKMCA